MKMDKFRVRHGSNLRRANRAGQEATQHVIGADHPKPATALPMNLGSPESCRRFPLSPSEGERLGERGPTWASRTQSASGCRAGLSRRTADCPPCPAGDGARCAGRGGNKKGPTRVGPWLNTQIAYLLPAFAGGWVVGDADGRSVSFGFNFSSRISTPASFLSFAM